MELAVVDMSELGMFLQREIAQRGWSLRDAQARTGISKTAISNLLRKEAVVPTADTLKKLHAVFGVPVWRLLQMCGYELGLTVSMPGGVIQGEEWLARMYDDVRAHADSMSEPQITAAIEALKYLENNPDLLRHVMTHGTGPGAVPGPEAHPPTPADIPTAPQGSEDDDTTRGGES